MSAIPEITITSPLVFSIDRQNSDAQVQASLTVEKAGASDWELVDVLHLDDFSEQRQASEELELNPGTHLLSLHVWIKESPDDHGRFSFQLFANNDRILKLSGDVNKTPGKIDVARNTQNYFIVAHVN